MKSLYFSGGFVDSAFRVRRCERSMDALKNSVLCSTLHFKEPGRVYMNDSEPHWTLGPFPGESVFLGLDRKSKAPLFATFSNRGAEARNVSAVHSQLDLKQGHLVGKANSILSWAAKTKVCSECGTRLTTAPDGCQKKCPADQNVFFPRIDPCIIVLVGCRNHCLLVQTTASKAPNRFSCIAGFMDSTETPEEAVCREVYEEVGLELADRASYISSQSWPMPNQLMLGFIVETSQRAALQIDTQEIREARWIHKEEVRTALQDTQAQLQLPSAQTIAGHLLTRWVSL